MNAVKSNLDIHLHETARRCSARCGRGYAPAVVNEAWVWVNGRYAGHRTHTMPWSRPQAIDLEITALVRTGQRNQITSRVLNNIDVFGASGIYERMFIYARTPISGNLLR